MLTLPGTTAVRTNVVGDIAVVHLVGTLGDGKHDEPVLVERFPFGWQSIDDMNFAGDDCAMLVRVPNSAIRQRLLGGMPKVIHGGPCRRATDVGPHDDVVAVRALQKNFFIPRIAVVGEYAAAEWYSLPGGEYFYKKINGIWQRIGGGGGAYRVDDLKRYGIPPSVARKLLF